VFLTVFFKRSKDYRIIVSCLRLMIMIKFELVAPTALFMNISLLKRISDAPCSSGFQKPNGCFLSGIRVLPYEQGDFDYFLYFLPSYILPRVWICYIYYLSICCLFKKKITIFFSFFLIYYQVMHVEITCNFLAKSCSGWEGSLLPKPLIQTKGKLP
jgi:hypothetical protein